MAQHRKAPAPAKRKGFDCRLLAGGDNEANATIAARIQALLHLGLSLERVALVSSLAYGEGRPDG